MKDLQLASWDLVPEICGILREKNWTHSVTSYNVLNGFNELRTKFPDLKCTLLTPGGTLDENATFAIAAPTHRYQLHVETLDPDLEGLANILAACPYIDWTKSPTISCMHERLFPILDQLERRLPNNVRSDCPVMSYHIENAEARQVKFSVPDDIVIDSLKVEHAKTINDLWPHGQTPESLLEVQDAIRRRESVGIFHKSTGELMAWSLYGEYGGAGSLHVKPEHQRKGYGAIALGTMTKILAEKGLDPHAFLTIHNTASKGLFTKLGYRPRYRATWTTYEYCNKSKEN